MHVVFADGERDNYNTVLRKFDNYCTPRVNETYERYVFRTCLQRDEETIEQYVTDLKYKAKSCNYGDLEESLIRDQIVLGTPNVKVKERLLSIDDLNLEKTVSICQASEVAKRQIRAMTDGPNSGTTTASVGAIKRSGHSSTSNHGNQTREECPLCPPESTTAVRVVMFHYAVAVTSITTCVFTKAT